MDIDIASEVLREEEALEGRAGPSSPGSSFLSLRVLTGDDGDACCGLEHRKPLKSQLQSFLAICVRGELPKEDRERVEQQTISCIKAAAGMWCFCAREGPGTTLPDLLCLRVQRRSRLLCFVQAGEPIDKGTCFLLFLCVSGESCAATMIFPAAQLHMEASLLSTRAWLAQGLEGDILEVGSAAARLRSLSLLSWSSGHQNAAVVALAAGCRCTLCFAEASLPLELSTQYSCRHVDEEEAIPSATMWHALVCVLWPQEQWQCGTWRNSFHLRDKVSIDYTSSA